MTNSHVIHDAEYISIKGLDNSQYHYRGTFLDDPSVDLAIIEVSNSPDHSYLPISKAVPVEGQNIVVIGNPEGEKGTVTTGIVSANRGPFFLFSAPISPGSSGSPILDEDGYVVGVVKGFRNDTQSQNMNLAVAASNINVGNESPDSPVTQNTPPVDEVPSLALRATPNATPDATWPDGRILTHPEHFVSAVAVKVKQTDTLKLRRGPGTRFDAVAEIPANASDISAFDQDQVWDGDTWWWPVKWRGFRGYVGRSYLSTDPRPTPAADTAMWPDGRILTHPEHFLNTGVVNVQPNDTLKLRSGPGTRFRSVAEIPANATDISAFDQDQVWDGDTWWCPVEWRGFRGYVGRSHLPTAR